MFALPPSAHHFDDAFLILQHATRLLDGDVTAVHSSPCACRQTATDDGCSARRSSTRRKNARRTVAVGADTAGLPYYQLLYLAFMSSETKRLYLAEIYTWFEQNTNKTQRGGWQNSIRHNLSTNPAFVKAEPHDGRHKSTRFTEWVMQDWAVIHGVRNTTSCRDRNARGPTSSIATHVTENPDDTTAPTEVFHPVTAACDDYSIVAFENCLYPIPA
ncbi:hypothetical protein NQ176_g6953 [Zarea fungicola]|uniref:Uncharacterized protein n=1 Tax=Zarea fungicola TaxID=93591 RepID=A0ACC1N2Y3_9HYPO|nr:hypothetical protein NQ176_g6953 [Lecanicillium fungicola]